MNNNNNKKRILFVNGNLSIGGTEKSLVNLLNAIDKDKYDIDLLLIQPGRELLPQLCSGINVISKDTTSAFGPIKDTILRNIKCGKIFELTLRFSLILPGFLGAFVQKHLYRQFGIHRKYDVAVAYRPGLSETIILNCVKANIKMTWWHHGDFSNGVDINKLRHNWKYFDRIVTVSDGIAGHIQTVIPEAVGKTEVIYNMINPVEIASKAKISNPYKCGCNDIKLVTVSRLSPEKNLVKIIKIAKCLLANNIHFKWAVIGGGEMKDYLNSLISRHELEEYVFLPGETDNPYNWMLYADLMVHPSLIESFGLVLIEAMSVGTPCIAAKSLGAKDVIGEGNGILVEDDSQEYLNAILRFINDTHFKSKLISNCQKSVERFFPEIVTNKFYSTIDL